ncbi:MAG: PH domain-containing protein [Solibacillus sp.]
MRGQPIYQLPEKARTVWRLYGVIYTVIMIVLTVGMSFIVTKFDLPQWIVWIPIAATLVVAGLWIVIFPIIRHKVWRYEVREQEIEIQSGLFIVKRTLIPMVRVQHVDTEQGPILKRYNLANISISSAATIHTIPMLLTEDADHLRERISLLARVAEDDV